LPIQDVVALVDNANLEDIVKVDGVTYNDKTVISGPGVALCYDKTVYCGPLINGEPIFDSTGSSFLAESGISPTLIRSKEVVVGHVIVDLVRLSQGSFAPKKVPHKLGVFSKDDLAFIDSLLIDIVKVFGAYVQRLGT